MPDENCLLIENCSTEKSEFKFKFKEKHGYKCENVGNHDIMS